MSDAHRLLVNRAEPAALDAISLEILWGRLIAAVDEGATALLRTAFTTIIRESNDYAVVLMDSTGDTIAECSAGIPAFGGLLSVTTRALIQRFPLEEWREGDVVMTNDPWLGTGHLPDLSMVAPIFYKGRLVGFSGTTAHLPDIGGSLGMDNRELFEEGICIPPLRAYRAGVRDDALFELLLNNVRTKELVLGDMQAQIAANNVCRERAIAVLTDTGLQDLSALGAAVKSKSEQAMRAAIAALPDGVYRSTVEADGLPGAPTHIECAITVAGDEMTVDYTGTSSQVPGPINCVLNYTWAYSAYPLKCALDPYSRRNAGSYRPLGITAPVGSILNAHYPAAVVGRHLTGHLLSCALYRALSEIMPERIIADSGGAPAMRAGLTGIGKDGRRFSQMLFASAGMGASPMSDGLSTTAFPTNSGAGSVEAMEAITPLVFTRKEYRVDSGGAGRFRGGLGQNIGIANITGRPLHLFLVADRADHPAQGMLGGGPGAAAVVSTSSGKSLSLKSTNVLMPGDSVTLSFPGGGGYGDPAQRLPQAIAEDIRLGLVTEDAARRDYGGIEPSQVSS